MRLVFLCGPPCSGKTTLAHAVAQPDDVVLDYDDIARALGSPVPWSHPEPWRTAAEHDMQAAIARAAAHLSDGTAWVIRTAPRAQQRAGLAQQWHATVYLLNPGRSECTRRAKTDQRPSGTSRSIGEWYYRHTPWSGDLNPGALHDAWGNPQVERGWIELDPETI
jgi:predicted kinase